MVRKVTNFARKLEGGFKMGNLGSEFKELFKKLPVPPWMDLPLKRIKNEETDPQKSFFDKVDLNFVVGCTNIKYEGKTPKEIIFDKEKDEKLNTFCIFNISESLEEMEKEVKESTSPVFACTKDETEYYMLDCIEFILTLKLYYSLTNPSKKANFESTVCYLK